MANLYWQRRAPGYGDFGDELSRKICEYMTGRSIEFSELANADLVALGSVLELEHALPTTWDQYTGYVWGTGRLSDRGLVNLCRARVWAVRGTLTLNGILCEARDSIVAGDPGLLAHVLARGKAKQFVLGFVPHWSQLGHPALKSPLFRRAGIRVIDPCEPVQNVVELIARCEHVLSSTLHGLVVADSLRIPNEWCRLKNGELEDPELAEFPFRDYYSVFGMDNKEPVPITGDEGLEHLLGRLEQYDRPGLSQIQRRLVESFPGPLRSSKRILSSGDDRARPMQWPGPKAPIAARDWQTLVLGIGTGRCGLSSLASILNRQPDTKVSRYEPPYLPWRRERAQWPVIQRVEFLLEREAKRVAGDVASYYLPYVEEMISVFPNLRVVCLKRSCEETLTSFCRWLDRHGPLRYNHWSKKPVHDWHHDPVWTMVYPQYDTTDREEGLRRYWDDYYRMAEDLARRFPEYVRVFDVGRTLNTEDGLRDLLTFIGIPQAEQVLDVRAYDSRFDSAPKPPLSAPIPSRHPNDPRRCVVLVPYGGPILPGCEAGLRELERRGYVVRRIGGYAAIDQGRNAMASGALIDGFEETMWIDSDIFFDADAVDQLRAHQLPIVCGVYSQKGKKAIACHIMPGTPKLEFGRDGGLIELMYAATGFLLVRREVYLTIQERLNLPLCNQRFTREVPMIPWFQPMTVQIEGGHWYLAEDYSFCQRARDCGYKIMADTSLRLWHVGTYQFGWEDAGRNVERFDSFTLSFR